MSPTQELHHIDNYDYGDDNDDDDDDDDDDVDDDDDDDVCRRPLVKWIQSDLRLDQTSTHQLATRSSHPHHNDVLKM